MCKLRHYNGSNGRRNHFGTIERKGSGKFMARWFLTDAQGKKFRKSKMLQADNIEDARRELASLTKMNAFESNENALLKLKARLEGVQAERDAYVESQPAMRVADIFEAYCRTRSGSHSSSATKRMYEGQVNRLVKWLGDHHPDVVEARQITRAIAHEFSDYLAANFEASHNRYMGLFTAIWTAIMRKEEEEAEGVQDFGGVIDVGESPKARLTINPWEHTDRIRFIAMKRRELTTQEIHNLLNIADGEWLTLAIVILTTGLREKDAVLLTHESCNLDDGFIKIQPAKVKRHMVLTDEWTYLPILPDLRNILLSVPEPERHGYVMPQLAELYTHSSADFSYHVMKLFRKAGLDEKRTNANGRSLRIGLHDLRHTHASILNRSLASMGMPNALAITSAQLSHHSLGMTKRYVHTNLDDLKNQMRLFPRLLPSP